MPLDYDVNTQYHLRKANKVADALSIRIYYTLTFMRKLLMKLAKEIKDVELMIDHGRVTNLEVQPVILNNIREA